MKKPSELYAQDKWQPEKPMQMKKYEYGGEIIVDFPIPAHTTT